MANEQPTPTALVTGASSGIGRATCNRLANAGWHVFAGARVLDERLPQHENITPLKMDISDFTSIGEASSRVAELVGENGLTALVNNASVTTVAPMEHVTPTDLHRLYEVNVLGLVAVTQAFLGLIRKAHGRILNISSIAALTTVPFGGALCSTKRAIEAITDALRLELMPSGIRVIMIRPATLDPAALDQLSGNLDELVLAVPEEGQQRYGAELREFLEDFRNVERGGSPPEVVAEAIFEAIISEQPHPTYMCGHNSMLLQLLQKWVPREMWEQLVAQPQQGQAQPQP